MPDGASRAVLQRTALDPITERASLLPAFLAVCRFRSYPLAIELPQMSSRTVAYAGNRGVRYFGLRFLGDWEKFAGQPAGGGARMTMPPQPGPWPPQGPPPSYYPQQPGSGGPSPPTQSNTIKWLLIGVGLLLVIAITVGVTVLVTNGGNGGDGQSTTTSASGPPVASADDNGPVEIITSEPTCQAWMPARDAMARVLNSGWGDRDPAIPAADWTQEQRAQYEATARSLKDTANQAAQFARETPHRVVRELYEQFIAYARSYAVSIPTYTASDNFLAQAHLAASYAIESICNSITYGSATLRATSVTPIDPPTDLGSPNDPADPERVITASSPTCQKLSEMHTKLVADTDSWSKYDPNVAFGGWPAERKAEAERTKVVLSAFADQLADIGPDGGNSTFSDISALGAVYLRAYASALSTYEAADTYLFIVGTRANNLLVAACDAVAG